MELRPGDQVDRYVVDGHLGSGGMAAVYRVRHRQLGTLHALKVLTIPAQSIRERLLQEGRVQATLRHPNIVAVTDVVEIEGAPGLVMEYIEGPTLDGLLRAQQLSIPQVSELGRAIIAGVRAAHERGLVHRDLKPGNILIHISDDGLVPKIADFGLAKIVDDSGGPSLTRSGLAMGTPSYMAPEQIRNAKGVDARADIFSLGAVLYELLTTARAFEGEDTFEVFSQVTSGRYRPIEALRPEVPPRMVAAVQQALEVDLDERVPSCAALLELWIGTGTDAAPGRGASLWDHALLERAEELSSSGALAASAGASAGGGMAAATPATPATGTWFDEPGPPSSMEVQPPPASLDPAPPPAVPAPSAAAVVAPAPAPAPAPAAAPASQPSLVGVAPASARSGALGALVGGGVVGVLMLVLGGGAVLALVVVALFFALGQPAGDASTEPVAVPAAPAAVEPAPEVPEPDAAPAAPAATPATPRSAQPPAPASARPAPTPPPAAAPTPPEPPAAPPAAPDPEASVDPEVPVDPEAPADPPPAEAPPAAPAVPQGQLGRVEVQVRYHPISGGSVPASAVLELLAPDGTRYPAGEPLPPGSYAMEATFGTRSSPVRVGSVSVAPGETVYVRCFTALKECRLR